MLHSGIHLPGQIHKGGGVFRPDLQQRIQKDVNAKMVLRSNSKQENAIQKVEGQVTTLKLHTEERIGKTVPPTIRLFIGGWSMPPR